MDLYLDFTAHLYIQQTVSSVYGLLTCNHSELFSLTRVAGHQAPPPLSVPSRPFSAPTLLEEKLELELSWLSLIPPELRPSGDWQELTLVPVTGKLGTVLIMSDIIRTQSSRNRPD